MSRTIRCKGLTPPENWLISQREHQEYEKGYRPRPWRNWPSLIKDTFKETRKAELKKAHSDSGFKYFWQGSPPAHFRRGLNAQRRVKEKHNLVRSLKKDLCESYLPVRPPRLNDVWWMWD